MAPPVFKTGATRPRRAGWVRFPHAPATPPNRHVAFVNAFHAGAIVRRARLAVALVALSSCSVPLGAQQADSARVGVRPAPRPTLVRDSSRLVPPISPRRAFLTSLLVPGLGQEQLRRPRARTLFALVELASAFMIVKSAEDLQDAKEACSAEFCGFDGPALPRIGPDGFRFETRPIEGPDLIAARVRARRTHLEDWIALMVFNHLLAGADAYVAAHLWDLPAQVSTSQSMPRTIGVGIRRTLP